MMLRNFFPRFGAVLAIILWTGCAHEVVRLNPEMLRVETPAAPIPLTVAVVSGSFDKTRLHPQGIVEYFVRELRAAKLFEGVLYPIPPGENPIWQIELAGSDSAVEPNSNFWRSALVTALPPLAAVFSLQNDYTLNLEALLLQRRKLVRDYQARATIRHRYQYYADRTKMEAEGVEVVVGAATSKILNAIAQDTPRLEKLY